MQLRSLKASLGEWYMIDHMPPSILARAVL
jgi:hypothetical protein